MKFNVAQLLKERTGSKKKYKIDSLVDAGEYGETSPVNGEVSLMFTGISILAQGNLQIDRVAICARCLGAFSCVVQFSIDEEYLPLKDRKTGLKVDSLNVDGFMIDDANMVDLSEAVRQSEITNRPMNLVCRPDCLGICGSCGADSNKVKCQCVSANESLKFGHVEKYTMNSSIVTGG